MKVRRTTNLFTRDVEIQRYDGSIVKAIELFEGPDNNAAAPYIVYPK